MYKTVFLKCVLCKISLTLLFMVYLTVFVIFIEIGEHVTVNEERTRYGEGAVSGGAVGVTNGGKERGKWSPISL